MNNNLNIAFANQHLNELSIMQAISDALTRGFPNFYYFNRLLKSPCKIIHSDLDTIRGTQNLSVQITLREPVIERGRITDFGDFQVVHISDLMIPLNELQIYIGDHRQTTVFSLEDLMQINPAWRKNDFALILSFYNQAKGDESVFQNLIYDAIALGDLTPVDSSLDMDVLPSERNYLFRRESLLRWAQLEFKLPQQLADIIGRTKPEKRIIPPKEKYAKWTEIAKKHKNKDLSKSIQDLIPSIRQELEEINPEYLMKDEKNSYPDKTIKRRINECLRAERDSGK